MPISQSSSGLQAAVTSSIPAPCSTVEYWNAITCHVYGTLNGTRPSAVHCSCYISDQLSREYLTYYFTFLRVSASRFLQVNKYSSIFKIRHVKLAARVSHAALFDV